MRSLVALTRVAGGGTDGGDGDPDADEHRFEGTFATASGRSWLRLEGVATSYDVLVDGSRVAGGTSMFERHRIALDLAPGEHTLEIVVHPLAELLEAVPSRPRPRWRTAIVEDQRLRWVRTTLLGRCPGLPLGPPPVGPWRPVIVETGPEPMVERLVLASSIEGDDGVLRVEAVISRADAADLVGDALVELDGPDGRQVTPLVDGRAELRVPGVRRWWPHTHGEPVLYDVRVLLDGIALALPGDGTTPVEGTRRRIGFRELGNGAARGRPDTAEHSVDVHVNGVPVFCRGAVWTPGDLGALDEAVALGLNLIRVPGWASYESDAFHDRCDELGLLVWQDLAFANLDVRADAPALVETVRAEVLDEVGRLGRHPSAIVVCGSSDTEQQAAMYGLPRADSAVEELSGILGRLVDQASADVLWVPSAPTGGELPFRVGSGVATYFGVGGYRRPVSDARLAQVRFAAECLAFAQVPDEPPERGGAGWGAGVPRDGGASWDFDDVREHYLRDRYGDVADEDWLTLSQRVTGEVMAEVFGIWRTPDHPCRGAVVLSLRDLVEGPGWGLLDHLGRPKPGARGLAPALAPRAVWLRDDGLDGVSVQIANDTASPLRGHLTVALTRADGSTVIEASTDVTVVPRGHLSRGVEDVLGRFVDASYAFRFGPRAHDAVEARLDVVGGERLAARWVVAPAATPGLSAL